MWTAASAEESVIVTSQAVATNPRSTSTSSLPSRTRAASSIAIEPCPCGLCSATRLYIGRAPKRVRSTMRRVAIGERTPRRARLCPGWSKG